MLGTHGMHYWHDNNPYLLHLSVKRKLVHQGIKAADIWTSIHEPDIIFQLWILIYMMPLACSQVPVACDQTYVPEPVKKN
jgi:hypothetical protein